MVMWAGEEGMGTHIFINNGIVQTLFSHKTQLRMEGSKKPELEAVIRHMQVSNKAHHFIRLRDY